MKNSVPRYIATLIVLGVFLSVMSVVFAGNGITAKACQPKPKKVFSGTAEIGEERKSAYPFTIVQGSFELLRGYAKSACEMSIVISSDIEDSIYFCKGVFAQTGRYSGFSCHLGGAEKERAIDASTGDWLSNPSIFIGPGYQDKMEINFEAQREDGMNAGYVPGVIGGVTNTDVNVSIFVGH